VDVIKAALQAVLDAAEARLDECSEPVGQTGILPGASIAWDNCCDGQLWVRVIDITPIATTNAAGVPCVTYLKIQAALGLVRCWAIVDDDGVPPSAAEMEADATSMLVDADALMAALQDVGATVSRGVPLGPQGNCGGWEWTFTFLKTPCVGCESPGGPS
jgi:hypothetical protein